MISCRFSLKPIQWITDMIGLGSIEELRSMCLSNLHRLWSGETIPSDSQITVYLRCQHSAIFSTFASLSDSINRTEIQLKGWLWRYMYIYIYIHNLNGDLVAKVLCVWLPSGKVAVHVFPQHPAAGLAATRCRALIWVCPTAMPRRWRKWRKESGKDQLLACVWGSRTVKIGDSMG